jgi:hypothetical protein
MRYKLITIVRHDWATFRVPEDCAGQDIQSITRHERVEDYSDDWEVAWEEDQI